MAVLWEPIDFLHPSILLTGKRDESFEKERLSTPPPFFFTLNFSYYDRKGKVREMKTGSEAVSHDVCVCVSNRFWCSNARALSHSPPFLSQYVFLLLFPPSPPQPYTKLSALWTFLTIYVGQGQDRLNRSASLSPCRCDSAGREGEAIDSRRHADLFPVPPPSTLPILPMGFCTKSQEGGSPLLLLPSPASSVSLTPVAFKIQ